MGCNAARQALQDGHTVVIFFDEEANALTKVEDSIKGRENILVC